MTQDQFNNTFFTKRHRIKYDGQIYPLAGVDFKEQLLAYHEEGNNDLTWVRCENVELLEGE
jgi:hypothetical protein